MPSEVAFVCQCGKSIIRDSEEHDFSGTIDDTEWFCSECLGVKFKEEEDSEEEELIEIVKKAVEEKVPLCKDCEIETKKHCDVYGGYGS